MSKVLRAAAAAAVLTVAAAGSGPAWADHTPGGLKGAAACAPSGTALALTAETHKFDKDCLAVTAGKSFTIRFDNRDTDRHNVAILPSHTATKTIFAGDIVPGPKSTVYAVPNMKAGTYHFHCEVHPNLMNGTFVVAAPPEQAPKAATPPPMTAGEGKAVAPAAPTTTVPKAAASKATPPRTAAAAAPATSATTTPARAAAAAAAGTSAATDTPLPRTGPAENRLLLLLAGLALAAGGLSVLGGARARG